jgi:hypothetical protein
MAVMAAGAWLMCVRFEMSWINNFGSEVKFRQNQYTSSKENSNETENSGEQSGPSHGNRISMVRTTNPRCLNSVNTVNTISFPQKGLNVSGPINENSALNISDVCQNQRTNVVISLGLLCTYIYKYVYKL